MNVRYLAYFLPFLFCCCSKSQSGSSNPNGGNVTFTTSYDSVITCQANSKYYFTFGVNVLSGDIAGDPIYCSIVGLPSNITDTPASLRVAQLQGGVFTLSIGNVPVGTDTVHFVVTSSAYGGQTHDLILKIVPAVDYAALLVGTYDSSYDFCTPSIINYTAVVAAVADTPSEITIDNIKNLGTGFVVRAWVTNVVTIPAQTVDGYTIWGTGTFTRDSRPAYDTSYIMTINDTLVPPGNDTETCTIHIQH